MHKQVKRSRRKVVGVCLLLLVGLSLFAANLEASGNEFTSDPKPVPTLPPPPPPLN
jgi:hypothetical protein